MSPTPQILGRSIDIIEGAPTVDLQVAITGDYVGMKNNDRVAVMFRSGVGTAGQDPTITLQQATSAGGGSVKDLDFTVIYSKQAATDQSAITQWTRNTQTAANTYTDGDAAEQSATWIIEFKASDLDVDGGFDFLRATIASVGAAQPADLLYLVQPMHTNSPENVVSSLG